MVRIVWLELNTSWLLLTWGCNLVLSVLLLHNFYAKLKYLRASFFNSWQQPKTSPCHTQTLNHNVLDSLACTSWQWFHVSDPQVKQPFTFNLIYSLILSHKISGVFMWNCNRQNSVESKREREKERKREREKESGRLMEWELEHWSEM